MYRGNQASFSYFHKDLVKQTKKNKYPSTLLVTLTLIHDEL